jgi:K+-transporting ATPase ATPase B chain
MGRRRKQVAAGFGALRANLSSAESSPRCQSERSSATPPETVATLQDGSRKMAFDLAPGDVVVVCAGEIIPADGTVIEGIAMVEESVITGESAPVIRESGSSERSAVTAGARVVSESIVVEVS